MIAKLLQIANVTLPYRVEEFSRKDSLEMTDADREQLRERIAHAAETRDRRHARYRHDDAKCRSTEVHRGKTIVFTGALAPARFAESDAPFNLGMAFGVAQSAAAGVYIAMNGQVFRAGEVRKDRANAKFVSV